MNKITRFSLKNALAIIIVVIMIAAGGLYSASQLNRESMPDITIPIVSVATVYPGAAPDDVYNKVTKPLETALRGVKGVKSVTAQSNDSFSMIITEFGYSEDMDKAEQNIEKAVQAVKLPDLAQTPSVSRLSMSSGDMLKISVTSKGEKYTELSDKVNTKLLPALKGIDGVGSATVATDPKTQIRITFDSKKLKKEDLKVSDIVQQMQAASLAFPAGTVDLGKTSEPVRVSGTVDSVADIENFVIAKYPTTASMMGDAFGQVGTAFSQVGKGMSALGQGIGKVGSATGKVAANTGLVNGIQQIQGNLVDLKLQKKDAENGIAALQQQIAMLNGQIQALDPTAPGYDAQLSALNQQKTALETKVQSIQGGLTQINGAITKMETTEKSLQKSINKNNAELMKSAQTSSASQPSASGSSSSMGTSKSSKINIDTVKLKDVATVTYGPDNNVVMSKANGQDAVLISVKKTQDGNTVTTAKAVRAKLASMKSQLGPNTQINVIYDASDSVNQSVDGMVTEGLLGAFFAMLIILLFLRNWRATTVVGFSIPVSVLTALLSMKLFGVTLNAMTLGGLTVAIGRVVDDSIVVVENIFRNIQEGAARTPEMIAEATREVSSAITASTITTVAVFLPLGFVSGMVGKVFMPFAITVTVALLASLLVAITLIPVLSRYFLMHAPIASVKERKPSKLAQTYERVLNWGLNHKARMIVGALALFVASLALIPAIGTGFMPSSSENYMTVAVEYPQGAKATTVNETVTAIERKLKGYQEVSQFQTTVGTAADGSGSSNTASIFIKGKDNVKDFDSFVTKVRKDLTPIEKANKDVSIVTTKQQSISGMSSGLQVTFTGSNQAKLKEAADGFMKAIADVPNLENLKNDSGTSRKQVEVVVDQRKAAKYGLSTAMVMGAAQAELSSQDVGTIDINSDAMTVTYQTDDNKLSSPEEVGNIKLSAPTGDTIAIKDVASVKNVDTPVKVVTKDGQRYAEVTADITSSDTGTVIKEVNKRLATYKLPKGVSAKTSGVAERMTEAFGQLGMAMLVAVFAVFLCLVIAFGEATAPFVILFALPLAAIGGLFGLFIARLPLDMPAMIGALMLIGIVVTNAVVFVDRVNQQLKKGLSRHDALIEAGRTRMRPILMTALATIIALIPMASGLEHGALVSQSLAVIVLGGMASSTFLTLLIVPVLFDALESLRDKFRARRANRDAAHDEIVVDEADAQSAR